MAVLRIASVGDPLHARAGRIVWFSRITNSDDALRIIRRSAALFAVFAFLLTAILLLRSGSLFWRRRYGVLTRWTSAKVEIEDYLVFARRFRKSPKHGAGRQGEGRADFPIGRDEG